MAKKRLKIKDRQGNVVDYDISAASITIDIEGKSLDVKLSEIAAALLQAVTEVTFNGTSHNRENGKINIGNQMQPDWSESSTTYPSYIRNKPNLARVATSGDYNDLQNKPESGGTVECDDTMSSTSENPVQNKVIKAYVDSLINGLINGAPSALDTLKELADALGDNDDAIATLTTLIGSKANNADVVKSISVNGGTAQTPTNGNVNIVVQGGNGNVSVIQPDPADGTFIIRVGANDFTINLNHTHPEYAPLVHTHSQYAQVQVVNGESNLPATLDPKTVYGVKADGVDELEMVVIGGYKFYGGGGGAPGQPVLMKPDAGSTIVISGVDNGYSGNVLDPKSVQVYIKARNITQPISVSVSGNEFSIENNVNQIVAADAIAGATINVLFDGSANSQGGTLLLQSTELGQVPRAFDIEVEHVNYELLDSVETDGRQWAKSSSKINTAVTKVEMDVQFSANGNTASTASTGCGILSSYSTNTPSAMADGILAFYSGSAGAGNTAGSYAITFITNGSNKYNNVLQQLKFHNPNSPDATFLQRSIISFTPGTSNATVAFNGKSANAGKADATSVSDTYIGLKPHTADDVPFNKFNMKIYNIKFTENQIVVHNFVPVLREDVAGLYDTVTDEFIVSETGTDFIAHHISNNS